MQHVFQTPWGIGMHCQFACAAKGPNMVRNLYTTWAITWAVFGLGASADPRSGSATPSLSLPGPCHRCWRRRQNSCGPPPFASAAGAGLSPPFQKKKKKRRRRLHYPVWKDTLTTMLPLSFGSSRGPGPPAGPAPPHPV